VLLEQSKREVNESENDMKKSNFSYPHFHTFFILGIGSNAKSHAADWALANVVNNFFVLSQKGLKRLLLLFYCFETVS
jgi:hypothetical protein